MTAPSMDRLMKADNQIKFLIFQRFLSHFKPEMPLMYQKDRFSNGRKGALTMKRISLCKLAALLLCLILPLSLLSACVSLPPVPSLSVPRDSAAVTTPVTEAAPPVSSEAEPERDPGEGASLRKIFGDADLSQEQLLYADQLCFCLKTEKGVRAQIMDLETLERRLEGLGPLPRTRYYEQLLSEDYRLLFSAYDMALELGSAKFCFPTRSLRARDVSEIVELLNASYPLFDARPRFSVTRDLTDGSGEKYRFLTVCFTNCSPEKLWEHHLAVARLLPV